MKLLTVDMINERNAAFWLVQNQLMEELILDDLVLALATKDVESDMLRPIPMKAWISYEKALPERKRTVDAVRVALARQGGKAPKGDALHRLIEEIVLKNPKITVWQLLRDLQGDLGAEVVTAVDGPTEGLAGVREIHYVNDGEKHKHSPLSGLKHRLARAKAKIKSR